ncbi:hypothetical protein HMPREF3213_02446 [Heyndrickxia coagulans]|uniref:Uncharacterized protein n=1 Tax=Heyndrickxia coagulans TaxID=1398 RepID=A0A133KK21_HEYCO|nr:hypothetical protein HMPREF3213_02446 [Heyndrickxia coagulans]
MDAWPCFHPGPVRLRFCTFGKDFPLFETAALFAALFTPGLWAGF